MLYKIWPPLFLTIAEVKSANKYCRLRFCLLLIDLLNFWKHCRGRQCISAYVYKRLLMPHWHITPKQYHDRICMQRVWNWDWEEFHAFSLSKLASWVTWLLKKGLWIRIKAGICHCLNLTTEYVGMCIDVFAFLTCFSETDGWFWNLFLSVD
jgi:hypothetical protein